MTEERDDSLFHSVDAVVFESKKKQNPAIDIPQEEVEEEVKGKKVMFLL